MNRGHFLKITVCLTLIIEFLARMDCYHRPGGGIPTNFNDTLFAGRHMPMDAMAECILPFTQFDTLVGLLSFTLTFARTVRADRWQLGGLSIKPEYEIDARWPAGGTSVSATVKIVLHTMWDACQHAADWPNDPLLQRAIVFDEGIEFNGADMQVRFASDTAFGLFVMAYLGVVRRIALEDLHNLNQ